MKKIIFVRKLLLLLFSTAILFPKPVYAQLCVDAKDFSCLVPIFSNILGIALAGAGLGSFVMIIIGGFKWLTSGGDPKGLESAKGRITFGIFGLVIMISSWFVLRFVSEFTGVIDILKFQIPRP